jgi:hypothetical protein
MQDGLRPRVQAGYLGYRVQRPAVQGAVERRRSGVKTSASTGLMDQGAPWFCFNDCFCF